VNEREPPIQIRLFLNDEQFDPEILRILGVAFGLQPLIASSVR